MYWGHHYWGMHGFWWIFWALLIIFLLSRAWPGHRASDTALDELRRRYAAGEIDDEEYQHRLEVLTPKSKPVGPAMARRARHKARQKSRHKGGSEAHAK